MRIEKNTSQSASVALGRSLTQGCMQRTAIPLKNACIFEKRVDLFDTLNALRQLPQGICYSQYATAYWPKKATVYPICSICWAWLRRIR